MKRIILVILRNILFIPYGWITLCHYAKHTNKYPEEQKYALIRKFSKWMIKGGRINLEVYGKENLPIENGYMIFPNHQGLFDGFAIAQGLEVPFSTVYKKELDSIPFVKQVLLCVKAIALDREDVRQSLKTINQVAAEVKNGRNLMIFPEGTRSKNRNELLDFKGGSFKSAIKAECPIVPVALIDSYKVFDSKSIKRITVQVHFLQPLYYEQYKGMSTSQIAEMVKAAIKNAITIHTRAISEF
ncbi:lysophospholipid acyltransferase family protein [Paenibacillus apis]|uniref:1-acyl-sn-glycerol-3-phosphate acyltransferase n=1 Tax=Paenibacillus apis TaxID=1792174 RepID=A0A920CIC3_9BACL|nr:lysophospholipid acyltransferase family protein [Paenibacillus apis]GIO40480.1 1-acyl-sn-glycerol-3-phosphate acyltransferase [Paenibacillus apis]